MAQAPAPQTKQPRPKIGLALEGGGALGFAHIGILQWLEKNRIPIDYIAGTSMGGLVGGLYATGQTGAELEGFVKAIDWNQVLSRDVPFRDLIFRRKEDKRAYPMFFEFGWRDGFSLPSGFSSGENIGLMFDEAALPYGDLKSFDELPIPYRCIATELTTAKSEVISSGSLATALRSTMAIPGVFTPVERGGKAYVDGGLLQNLPVDIVRQMGADIVIAVHLQIAPFEAKDLKSPIVTLSRSISVVIAVNELRSMQKADILITVPLEKFTSDQFEKSAEILEIGKTAGESKVNLLRPFALEEAEYQAWRNSVAARKRSIMPTPEFIHVTGTRPELADSIAEDLEGFVGKPVDPVLMERAISRVTGIGRFSKVDYGTVQRDGRTGLLLTAQEKNYAPPSIQPLILLNGADYDDVQLTVGSRITWLDVGSYRTEIRADFQVGSAYGAQVEYYRPLHPTSRWFIAPRGFALDQATGIYDAGDRLAEYRVRTAGGAIDIGITPTRNSELRAGYRLERQSYKRSIGEPSLPTITGTTGATSIRYVLDKLDDGIVPRDGIYSRSRLEFWDKNIGSNGGFPLAETSFWYFRPVSKPASVFAQASAGTTFGNEGVGLPVFAMGGVGRMGAYGTNEFRMNQYWYGRVGYLHELGRLPLFAGRRIFGLAATEVMKPYGQQSTRLAADAVTGVLIETFFGPVVFAGAVGESGHRKIYFQVGRYF